MGRDHWSSRVGFILAATGSAIGLGNLWKFPYITWHNNGGAFVLIYLICVVVVGLPIMMAEILLGRKTQESPVPAFIKLGGSAWGGVGMLGVVTGFVILGYYSVIAGWTLKFFIQCLSWSFSGYSASAESGFGGFLADGTMQLLLSALFSGFTIAIILMGVSKGIERVTKILMPILFLIMLYLLVTAFTLSGCEQAFRFLFRPNFAELPAAGVLEALGHAFFTLSLGMGVMITYGSYLKKRESLILASFTVVVLDTLIAILACVVMYSIIFSVPGLSSEIGKSTVGMLFITLPKLFYTELAGGAILGPLFYILVAFAALTSTISLLEVIVAFFIDQLGWKRRKATLFCGGTVYIVTIFCALSLGAIDGLTSFSLVDGKAGILDHLDYLASNWLLPIGGFLTTLFVGWFISKKISWEQLELSNTGYKLWLIAIRFIAPAAILAVIIAVILGKDFS